MRDTFYLGNDTGTLGVFDDAALREVYDLDYHAEPYLEIVELPPGRYKVAMWVYDTYVGRNGLQVIIEVGDTSRGLVFGDICYAFNDSDWSDLCDATNCLRTIEHMPVYEYDDYVDLTEEPIPVACFSTGGDGDWDVDIKITRCEDD